MKMVVIVCKLFNISCLQKKIEKNNYSKIHFKIPKINIALITKKRK